MDAVLIIEWFGLSMFLLGVWEATWIWYWFSHGSKIIKAHLKPGSRLWKAW